MKQRKRFAALLMAAAMALSTLPLSALAVESPPAAGGLCEHHTEHTADCGYTPDIPGTECTHEHDAGCGYSEGTPEVPCDMGCTEVDEATGAVIHQGGCAYVPAVEGSPCQHQHDESCGYTEETPGTPCNYVCEICKPQDGGEDAGTKCTCETLCAGDAVNTDCPVCGAEGADLTACKGKAEQEETKPNAVTGFAALPLNTTEQFSNLTPGETYWFNLSGADFLPGQVNEGNQKGALPVPDKTLTWAPFTYAGTINAYVLNSASSGVTDASDNASAETDPGGEYGYTYDHSLFIADYNLTHSASWNELDEKMMIFGTDYKSGGVDYTLRAPSVGNSFIGLGDNDPINPKNNEWDAILNKNSDYIKNWNGMSSWGQDTWKNNNNNNKYCVDRGFNSSRYAVNALRQYGFSTIGFRPVLEIPKTIASGELKVVTIDLNGGKIGGTEDSIQMVVNSAGTFTAPGAEGLTRPDENTGDYFQWLGDDGQTYAPGETVPADVTKLTAQWEEPPVEEQFSNLVPGVTYWFDLSGVDIPGTVNEGNDYGATSVPDKTLNWVPFTYAGTVNAYVLNENSSGQSGASQSASETTDSSGRYGYTYDHSLFIADYSVTHTVSWDELNEKKMIFGTDYKSGGVDYTLRAPSTGSKTTGIGVFEETLCTPQNNEWDAILNKNGGWIKNWKYMYSWGQDTTNFHNDASFDASTRTHRGYLASRQWYVTSSVFQDPDDGFRPVLEIPQGTTNDQLKVVAIDLGGGSIGGTKDSIQMVVNSAGIFTAPGAEGLTRPDGNTGDYFQWLGNDGQTYAPGAAVPDGVTKLTSQWEEESGKPSPETPSVGDSTSPETPTDDSSSRPFRRESEEDSSDTVTTTKTPGKDDPTTPIEGRLGSLKPDANGSVTLEKESVQTAIQRAEDKANKNGTSKNGISILVPVKESSAQSALQIALPSETIDLLVREKVKRLAIDTGKMTDVDFTLDTLKALNRKTSGDILLKVKKIAVSSAEAKAAIGTRPAYDISLWEIKNGKETQITDLNGKTISVAIPYTPAKGEQPGSLYAVSVDASGKVQWLTKSSYDTDQKAVIFELTQPGIYGVGYDAKVPAFTDIENHWAKDNILFAVSRGLLTGTSDTTFSPDTGMTRGMFVTALGRLAGINPDDYQTGKFTDVKADDYYSPYINWAAKTGIVGGISSSTFAPDSKITREQMAVILKKYAAKLGYTIPKTLEAASFADNAKISAQSKASVKAMQQAGVLTGKKGNKFDPKGTATRAEFSTALRRFVEIVIDPQTANGWVQNDSGQWSCYKDGEQVKGWLSDKQK